MRGPLAYIGGKSRLARLLISLFPKHTTYAEPFAGGAQVFFHKQPSQVEVLNDLDGEIVNFFRVCQWHHQELIRYLSFCLTSRSLYNQLLATSPSLLTDVQRAGRFFYLQKNSFGGLRLNRHFHYSVQKPTNYNVARIPALIKETHERLANMQIENTPHQKILRRYDRTTTLFYLDPPYFDRRLYKFNLSNEDFETLSTRLSKLKGRFILSLNDVPEVRRTFSKFEVTTISLAYSAAPGGRKRFNELI